MNISVCIPTYCRTEQRMLLLGEAIDSALRQTLPASEIVVADNRSPVDVAAFLKQRYAHEPRVNTYCHDVHVGMAANFDRAVRLCRGDLIKPMSDDDILHPEFLSICAPYAGGAFVWTGSERFLNVETIEFRSAGTPAVIRQPGGYSLRKMKGGGIFPTATMFGRGLYEEVGGYDHCSGAHFDHDFYVMCGLSRDLVSIGRTLCFFRVWPDSLTSRLADQAMSNYFASCYTSGKLLALKTLSIKEKSLVKMKLLANLGVAAGVVAKRLPLKSRFSTLSDYMTLIHSTLMTLGGFRWGFEAEGQFTHGRQWQD